MVRRVIIAVLLVVGAVTCAAQDFRKIVEIVDEMETSLRKSIVQEQDQRKSEVVALRRDLDLLRQAQHAAESTDSTGGGPVAEGRWREMDRRITLLEMRADKTGKDLAELTRAVTLLVQELKRSVK